MSVAPAANSGRRTGAAHPAEKAVVRTSRCFIVWGRRTGILTAGAVQMSRLVGDVFLMVRGGPSSRGNGQR